MGGLTLSVTVSEDRGYVRSAFDNAGQQLTGITLKDTTGQGRLKQM